MAEESGAPVPSGDDGRADGMLVVGIGASAGGIAALRQFFAKVPAKSGAAYAVVLHLSPDYESRLAEVLQTATSLPITQVQGTIRVQPDHIYVIAPNASLKIVGGTIVTEAISGTEERRAPVDLFFRTLADSYGRRAVAIVLSGTGPNGSSGLKRVKEHGGLTIAQAPDEAEYGDMPRNSIATGLVDYVLPVVDIPKRVLEYYDRLSQFSSDASLGTPTPADSESFRQIISLLRMRTGHDFANYKTSTILRRIERRLSLAGVGSLLEYADFLQLHADEAPALMKDLLISVTNFFRDSATYASLEKLVVPHIFQGKSGIEHVRVWVAGCATGEEAYSIAMLLAEHASGMAEAPPRLQVFASDLDEQAIAIAREGFYTDAEIADISHERLRRFFLREPGGYRVTRELREHVLFAVHNLIKDPPFSHLDLVACRNVLIYLNRSIQERLIDTFHFALRPGGYLFLGTAESPDGAGNFFVTLDKDAHLYQSRAVASRLALPLGEPAVFRPAAPHERRTLAQVVPDPVFPIDLHHRLIEEYAPPSLVVTDGRALVHVSQSAGQYLQIGRGEPSRDVLQLIHQDLRLDLRTALHQAAQQRSNVTVRGVRLTSAGQATTVNLVVRPVLRDGDPARGFFLIVIEQDPSTPAHEHDAIQLQSPAGTQDLEEELVRVRSQLGATIEQYETQVEEAKASNEELQATNEELRSSAEELETSREELQSVNEELTTVNQELKIKVEELRLTNNDFQNFINATSIPTVFLDRALQVKFSNTRAQEIFNLLPTDVGRPLSDITSRITYDRLLADATQVLDHLHTIEREVRTHEGRLHLMRILPYRTLEDRIEGVVITFVDVTTLRQAEADTFASDQRLRLLIETAPDYAIFTMDDEGHIDSWNIGAQRMWGYKAENIVGKHFAELFTPEDRAAGVPSAVLDRVRRSGRHFQERYHRREDGTTFYASGVTTRLGSDGTLGFAKIAHDLTATREAEAALSHAQDSLEERVDQRTSELAHEQEQVRGLLRALVTAQEDQRRRIARDLHDQLGQQLTALRLTLERGQQNRMVGRDLDDELERGLAIVSAVTEEVDFLAWELRPAVLDDLGLAAALPRFLREWSKHYTVDAEFRLSGFAAGHLSKEVEVTYYRVAQEALSNVMKHAHASRVDVVLETRDGVVTLCIGDDGIGFEMPGDQDRFGLVGMKERAELVGATLEVESSPGHGTTVYLRSPLARTPPKRTTSLEST